MDVALRPGILNLCQKRPLSPRWTPQVHLYSPDFMRLWGRNPPIPTTRDPRSEPNRPPM